MLLAPKVSTAATRCQRAGLPLFAQTCSFRWQAASRHLYEPLVLGQNMTPHGAVSQLASWASCASSVMTPGLTAVTAEPERRFPFLAITGPSVAITGFSSAKALRHLADTDSTTRRFELLRVFEICDYLKYMTYEIIMFDIFALVEIFERVNCNVWNIELQ